MPESAMEREKQGHSSQTIAKAIELLDALAAVDEAKTVQSLAKKLKLHRNKVVAMLTIMEQKGFIERDPQLATYRLGLHSFGMAQRILQNADMLRIVRPVMEDLAKKHAEAISFAVLDRDEVFFLDVVDTVHHIQASEMVGQRFPFFTNAAGKAIKSLSSLDLLERIHGRRRDRSGLPDPQELRDELAEIRKAGVAIDVGGFGDGVVTVAVAIRDYGGKVVGALTMLIPSIRMVQDRLEKELIPSMLEGAELLSMKFGYSRVPA